MPTASIRAWAEIGPMKRKPFSLSPAASARDGNALGIEAGERGSEGGPLGQDGQPTEAGLEGLEADPLEEGALAVHGQAPLGVVVVLVEGVGERPRAASQAVVAHHYPPLRVGPGAQVGAPALVASGTSIRSPVFTSKRYP